MIHGIRIRQLRCIPDERGRVAELFRSDWEEFQQFGQVYLTTAYPGVIKGWHYHKLQTDNFTCIKGTMKLVLYDPRPDSPTRGELNEFFIGDQNPLLVQIPPLVYHGFKCIGEEEAIVINIPTRVYNYREPDEYRLPHTTSEIPYSWERRNG